jgi:hypothetical protein
MNEIYKKNVLIISYEFFFDINTFDNIKMEILEEMERNISFNIIRQAYYLYIIKQPIK